MSYTTAMKSLTSLLGNLKLDKRFKPIPLEIPHQAPVEIKQLYGIAEKLVTAARTSKASAAQTELHNIDLMAKRYLKPNASPEQIDAFKLKLLECIVVPFYFMLLNTINSQCNSIEDQANQQKELSKLHQWIQDNLGLTLPALETFRILERIQYSHQTHRTLSPLIILGWTWETQTGSTKGNTIAKPSETHADILKEARKALKPQESKKPQQSDEKKPPSSRLMEMSDIRQIINNPPAAQTAKPVFESAITELTTLLNEMQRELAKTGAHKFATTNIPKDTTPEIKQLYLFANRLIETMAAGKSITEDMVELSAAIKVMARDFKSENTSPERAELKNALKMKLLELVVVPVYFALFNSVNLECKTEDDQTSQQKKLARLHQWIKKELGLMLPQLDFFDEGESVNYFYHDTPPLITGWRWEQADIGPAGHSLLDQNSLYGERLKQARAASEKFKAPPKPSEPKKRVVQLEVSQPSKKTGTPQKPLTRQVLADVINTRTPPPPRRDAKDTRKFPPKPKDTKPEQKHISKEMAGKMGEDISHAITHPKKNGNAPISNDSKINRIRFKR